MASNDVIIMKDEESVDVIGKSYAADYVMRWLSYRRREPAMRHSIPIGTLLNEWKVKWRG